MNVSACSSDASIASTSLRNFVSPAHAESRKAGRSAGIRSSAAWNSSSILFHSSLFTCNSDCLMEPRTGTAPLALHRRSGYPERLGRLFDVQATKEPQLDDLAFPRINRRQLGQCII